MDLTRDLRRNVGLKVLHQVLVLAAATFQGVPFKPGYTLSEVAYLAELVLLAVALVHSQADYTGRFHDIQDAQIEDSFRLSLVIPSEAARDIIGVRTGISTTMVNIDPFLGRGLAVLRLELSDTSSPLIEDSDNVTVEDPACAFGYLGVVTFPPLLSPNTVLAASVTQGVASRNKLTLFDIPAIQHNAPTINGNSGGPSLENETLAKP